MRSWIRTQRSWLVVERLPAYASELNPVEGLWSSLKVVELANLTGPTLAEVITRPTGASSGCAARRILPTRSCATPACWSHDLSPNAQVPLLDLGLAVLVVTCAFTCGSGMLGPGCSLDLGTHVAKGAEQCR
jgi:hypothetical protein